jgi:hypothetical protein
MRPLHKAIGQDHPAFRPPEAATVRQTRHLGVGVSDELLAACDPGFLNSLIDDGYHRSEGFLNLVSRDRRCHGV